MFNPFCSFVWLTIGFGFDLSRVDTCLFLVTAPLVPGFIVYIDLFSFGMKAIDRFKRLHFLRFLML